MKEFWVGLGLVGQALFAGRFLLQWLASERAGRSVVPRPFWLLSIGGALLLLGYSVHIQDPVFILGNAAGLLIYSRNLHLLSRETKPAQQGD